MGSPFNVLYILCVVYNEQEHWLNLCPEMIKVTLESNRPFASHDTSTCHTILCGTTQGSLVQTPVCHQVHDIIILIQFSVDATTFSPEYKSMSPELRRNSLLKHTTTLFSLSDHYILSREWRVIVDQVQTNYHGRPMVL